MLSLKKPLVICVLILFVVLGIAAVDQPRNERFKNLKVLPKDIKEDSLFALMDGYDRSLGVGCDFCHAMDKKADSMIFESDAKPEKEIARKMMRMTMDINIKYFQFNTIPGMPQPEVVSCTTCHRGQARPK